MIRSSAILSERALFRTQRSRLIASRRCIYSSSKSFGSLGTSNTSLNRNSQQQEAHKTTRSFSTAAGAAVYFGKKAFGSFHFGTSEYEACFQQLPQPGVEDFRTEGLKYLNDGFNAQTWYDDPISTVLKGVALPHETEPVDTHSALGQVNGRQVLASAKQVQQIKDHILSLTTSQSPMDLRDLVRQVEQDLLTNHAGELVGHQCVDFAKQDGATELEEMVMACVVERRLNDYLLLEEKRGRVRVNRSPIYVPCVSNFTHFLDLSRKVLRSVEVGIPVIVLGRTSTTQQHAYRWFQRLQTLCQAQQLDPRFLTYLSCSLPDTQDILQSCAHHTGNLYLTGSRALAAELKRIYPNTVASTGGPNTMVICTPKQANPVHFEVNVDLEGEGKTRPNPQLEAGKDKNGETAEEEEEEEEWFTPELKAAIRTSAAIESAGQCTALRHVIVPPNFTQDDVSQILAGVEIAEDPKACLQAQQFDGVFLHQATPEPPTTSGETQSYEQNPETGTYWRLNESLPSANTAMPEYWRKVVVDYSKLETDPWDYAGIDKLAHWLNVTQPISLAVNGNMVDSYKTMRRLFDRTALAVYTVGGRNNAEIPTSPHPKLLPPALTCQARPQEGEIFGEVPPRHSMFQYTKYPVYIPSSNPSYDTSYQVEYLKQQSIGATWNASSKALIEAVSSPEIRGYCCLLVDYLRNVDDENPKEVVVTGKARTVLWGIQRPPIQTKTVLRCGPATTWDACAPAAMLFHCSTARDQLQFSLSPDNAKLKSFCEEHKLDYLVETDSELAQRVENDIAAEEKGELFQVSYLEQDETGLMKGVYPMVGQFTSLYFPMGHVKSTAASDQEFLTRIKGVSRKWLNALF